MARTKQKLINYHTGSPTAMPQVQDVELGEIVVRHNGNVPQLLIKVSSGTTNEGTFGEWFVPFIASGDIATAIQVAVTEAKGTIDSDISNLGLKIDAVSATVKETYWTSAQTKTYVDNAKTEAINTASGYTDQQITSLSGNVVGAISAVTGGDLTDLKSRVQKLETFSGKVETDYATKEFVNEKYALGVDSAITAVVGTDSDTSASNTIKGSKKYTDEKFNELSGITSAYVASQLSQTLTDVSTLKSDVTDLKAFSGLVESDYATKVFVGAASGYAYSQAKTEVIGQQGDAKTANTVYGAKAYADDIANTVSGNAETAINAEKTRAQNAEDALDSKIDAVSGSVNTFSGSVVNYIDTRLTTVYKYQGSVANYTDLPAEASNGDVWNVQNGYQDVPDGTNYAWVAIEQGEGAPGHWDALGGEFDTSNLATTEALGTLAERVTTLESTTHATDTALETLSGAVESFSSSVVTNYATKEGASSEIAAASAASVNSAYTSSTAYTDQQIAILSGISSAYTDSKINDVNSTINTMKGDYALSSVTHTEIEAAKTAIIGADVTSSGAPINTITGLKLYSDEKDRQLQSEIQGMLNSFSGAMSGDFTNVQTQITDLSSRVSANEEKFTNSAATWNSALQGGELGTVSETTAGNGVTIQSGAKMKDDEANKKIVLDLSELVIDCGDF